jgi:hypothetical protein
MMAAPAHLFRMGILAMASRSLTRARPRAVTAGTGPGSSEGGTPGKTSSSRTLRGGPAGAYNALMIRIRFPDATAERRALGFLAGRFSFKSWADGETLVPAGALPALALEGVPFSVVGRATYEQYAPAVRDPAAPAV